ncbi:MAG: flagellar basal body P-ring formation chaperone FlgA [Pseudomonadota bacterium]
MQRTRRQAMVAVIAIPLALLLSTSAAQAVVQDLRAITHTAEMHVTEALGAADTEAVVAAEALDNRLRLDPCTTALHATLTAPITNRSARAVVRVACSGPQPWKLYVTVRVDRYSDVAVVVRPLPRGHRLKPNDLRLVRRAVTEIPTDTVTTIPALLGQALRQPLRAGDVVRRYQIEAPQLLTRGQSVTIVAGSSQFRVHMNGIVQSAGAAGGVVRVRNLSSGRMIQARVVDERHVVALGASH